MSSFRWILLGHGTKVIRLADVELFTNCFGNTTNSGLWRYLIGDTVFTSLNPYRIRVTGRTKHHINVFGEELMVENTDQAIAKAVINPNGSGRLHRGSIFMEGEKVPMNG
jgi:hypothetical protein